MTAWLAHAAGTGTQTGDVRLVNVPLMPLVLMVLALFSVRVWPPFCERLVSGGAAQYERVNAGAHVEGDGVSRFW